MQQELTSLGDPAPTIKYASLYIMTTDVWNSQTISFSLAPALPGDQIAFSMGPEFSPSSGISIGLDSGFYTMSAVSIQPQLFSISSPGAGMPGKLNISLYLVAGSGVTQFYLSSQSDSKVGIRVTVNNGPAYWLGENTLVDWH